VREVKNIPSVILLITLLFVYCERVYGAHSIVCLMQRAGNVRCSDFKCFKVKGGYKCTSKKLVFASLIVKGTVNKIEVGAVAITPSKKLAYRFTVTNGEAVFRVIEKFMFGNGVHSRLNNTFFVNDVRFFKVPGRKNFYVYYKPKLFYIIAYFSNQEVKKICSVVRRHQQYEFFLGKTRFRLFFVSDNIPDPSRIEKVLQRVTPEKVCDYLMHVSFPLR